MKSLTQYIEEKLIINKNLKTHNYNYFPQNKHELLMDIQEHYKKDIYDLNDIDTSQIAEFSYVFYNDGNTERDDFDISGWDVSNGEDFYAMFKECEEFNADLSDWDVSNGKNFGAMFYECEKFNGDLSRWDVSKGEIFSNMFCRCDKFNCDISNWDVRNGEDFRYMFYECKHFNCDLSRWKSNKKPLCNRMMEKSGLTEENYPSWFKK